MRWLIFILIRFTVYTKLLIRKMKKSQEISQTFCVYPWIEFVLGPTKHLKLCCIADEAVLDEKGQAYEYGKGSLEEHWNGYGLRQARKKMLEGEKIKACSHCYYQESIGWTSYRQLFNKQWLVDSEYGKSILESIEKSRHNGYKVERAPLYLDIRPGNLCNLKCRMCNPGNSSKIYKEQKDILEENHSEFAPLIDMYPFKTDKEEYYNWYKNPNIWDTIYKWAGGIRQIYFTGGEPTLIRENWKLIDYLKQSGYSKNIHLVFNINCTLAPNKLLDTFDHFKTVNLTLSIDGYKEVQEYIRHPSKWDNIESNILKMLDSRKDNVEFYFSPVVQTYNILDLPRFFKWVDRLNFNYGRIGLSLIMCTRPDFLDIIVLPKNIREKAFSQIEDYEMSYRGKDDLFLECLGGIKNVLRKKEGPDINKQLKNFYKYTKLVDQKRGEIFEDVFPELNNMLNEDGRWRN